MVSRRLDGRQNGLGGHQRKRSSAAAAISPTLWKGGRTTLWALELCISIRATRIPLFRIHGTNQPENIGRAISSGCIRMTNDDVIDLYNRVKMGTIGVVLRPNQIDSSPRFDQ